MLRSIRRKGAFVRPRTVVFRVQLVTGSGYYGTIRTLGGERASCSMLMGRRA